LEIAQRDDDGEPNTARRFYYLALSHGYIDPDMSASDAGKKSRDAAYGRILGVIRILRQQGRLDWEAVLDLTRDLDEWQTFASPREARAAARRAYDEDRWRGQPYYPMLIVEKDTLEPICKPMASRWQMPFASSRGYGSLKLQYDVANMLGERYARTKQRAIVYFISDLDPSGLDLERAWRDALDNFNAPVVDFVRIGLTREQVRALPNRRLRQGIEVKPSDSRARSLHRRVRRAVLGDGHLASRDHRAGHQALDLLLARCDGVESPRRRDRACPPIAVTEKGPASRPGTAQVAPP
jgi:hypothetical protein